MWKDNYSLSAGWLILTGSCRSLITVWKKIERTTSTRCFSARELQICSYIYLLACSLGFFFLCTAHKANSISQTWAVCDFMIEICAQLQLLRHVVLSQVGHIYLNRFFLQEDIKDNFFPSRRIHLVKSSKSLS